MAEHLLLSAGWVDSEQWDEQAFVVDDWFSPPLVTVLAIDDTLTKRGLDRWHRRAVANVLSGDRWATAIERSIEVSDDFERLAREWSQGTVFLASLREIVLHPAYQRIIGLGAPAVPLILREMQKTPNHWLWALTAIVGEDKAAGSAHLAEATRAWLAWGESVGLVS